MPFKFTDSGYIEVRRDDVLVSRHVKYSEAIQSLSAHSEQHGDGTYAITYPRTEVVVDRRSFIQSAVAAALAAAASPSDSGVITQSGPRYFPPAASSLYNGLTPTIYAAPADVGNGSGTSEANAMDLATALSTATPGAIIGCIPGTYTATAGAGRFAAAWQSASGTAGNPVRIVAKYQAITLATPGSDGNRCELAHTGSSAFNDANSSPIFGCSGDDYVEWYGFYCDERTSYSHADTGPVVLYDATGCKIVNCYIQGGTSTWTDNHCGIRSEETDDCEIRNNYIRDIQTSGSPNGVNVVGIQTYDSRNLLVEHNSIVSCRSGIFFKGVQNGVTSNDQHDITCRYNLITGITHTGIGCGMISSGTNNVYQNLIVGAGVYGLRLRPDAVTSGDATPISSTFWTVYNNTVDINDSTNLVTGIDNSSAMAWGTGVRDNVIVITGGSTSKLLYDSSSRTTDFPTMDYNWYWASTGTPYWNRLGTNRTPLATWQANSGGMDANSQHGDPSFTSRGTNWTIASGGALTASSTGGPVGCYITGNEVMGVVA